MLSSRIDLIVGLGNPGAKHEADRHNAGIIFLRELCLAYGGKLSGESKFFGEFGKISINNREVRLLFPTTFMNASGRSVASVAQFYKILPENILVAYDEIDFETGITRFKQGGGHGGHNGIRDIISALGGEKNFHRLRIGVGHPGNKALVANYVLGQKDPKRNAVKALKKLNFIVYAAGDSYNDTTMLEEADAGFLFRAPENVVQEFPQYPLITEYDELLKNFDKLA